MSRSDYADKCISLVALMREASDGDPALAELLNMFGLLQEPTSEELL